MGRVASRQAAFPAAVAAVLLQLLIAVAPATTCSASCGNINIPYPFGIEPSCYLDGFNVTCDHSYRPPKLFLGDGTIEVIEIFIPNGTVRINSTNIMPLRDIDGASRPNTSKHHTWGGLREGGPFFVAPDRNKFLVMTCNNVQILLVGEDNSTVNACAIYCPSLENSDSQPQLIRYLLLHGECSGLGCCDAGIPKGYTSYHIQIQPSNDSIFDATSSVYIAEEGSYNITKLMSEPRGMALPALLDWVINNSTCQKQHSVAPACRSSNSFCQNYTSYVYNGSQCRCSAGYQGNPYIVDGCQDINECVHPEVHSCHGICENKPGTFYCRCPDGMYGNPSIKEGCIKIKSYSAGLSISLVVIGGSILLLLAFGAPFVTRKIKLQKMKRRREKIFNQNHGLLLQQLISQKADIGERMIITLGEIEKATNNFDKSREVGGGGHGTVYKGILDLHVVAIKKSKIVVQREIDEFINEVAILSQINHRNVVKLLGCCLETEVPLLVYEFISNGTLCHHLHVEGPISLSWDDRSRIALEIARALAYLHSAASMPIFHRDIKSSNILLDESLTAKVSDFGASRYIPIDQTAVMTAVQGTFGYLDPMYYYTGRLTDKSDVFSFGVLLIELLTRKKPYVYRSDNDASLVAHFVSLLTKGNLADIIDPQVMEEDGEFQEVAILAAMCTRLEGESRPTMREVEMSLENLRARKKPALYNTSSERYDGDQIAGHYKSIEDLLARKDLHIEGETEELSRQYTMEEEILLSARYPR